MELNVVNGGSQVPVAPATPEPRSWLPVGPGRAHAAPGMHIACVPRAYDMPARARSSMRGAPAQPVTTSAARELPGRPGPEKTHNCATVREYSKRLATCSYPMMIYKICLRSTGNSTDIEVPAVKTRLTVS